jgi:hypothetical protein
MRPTVIRLISGGALGIAFSVSLMLPGTVVFPHESAVQHLAAPEPPSAKVVRVAPDVAPRKETPVRPRIVVQRIYVPAIRNARASANARHVQPRPTPSSRPPRKPVERTQPPPPAAPVAPMSAPPTEPEQAEEPRKALKPKEDQPRETDKPRKSEKPKKSDKPKKSGKPKKSDKPKSSKDRGSGKKDKGDRKSGDDDGDEHGHHDHDHDDGDGGGRGNNASRG